ncbi:MAG: BamA/TamA family outer membrane protein [Polyangiaceae bacterium]
MISKRSTLARLAGALVLGAALTASQPAHAVDDPSLVWWTLETAHFRITYPENLEQVARRIATVSEDINGRMTAEMQYHPDEKTEILLTDDTDSANGSASPIPYDAIRLYVTAPDDISTLGDYDDWYVGLVTHEYTHILHTGNISGLPAVANRIIGRTFSPNSAQPRWIIEGLAVVQESKKTSAGRIRSTLFDTFLRADVLEDNIARLDQISGGAQRWPYGNLFYLYGSRFLRWISEVYGPDVFPAISADYGATTIPFGINRAIRRVTGRTYEELYDGFLEHMRMLYKEQKDAVDAKGRREGVRITLHGENTFYPRFVPKELRKDPDKEELVYYRSDTDHREGIYRMQLGDPTKAGARDADLFIRTSTNGFVAFTPEGSALFHDTAYFKNVYARNDLFDLAKGETSTFGTEKARRQLTFGVRALYPDVSPDGKEVAYTVNSAGTTTLWMADRDADGTLRNERVLVANAAYDQAYTPRFSPDGKHLAYSAWSAGGYRDLKLVDLVTGDVRDLTRDRALDMQPVFSSDGKTLYFSSDRSGIFNIYAMTLETGELKMVTNTLGAALAPAISDDGKTLVYQGYTHSGYDLFAMPLDPALFLEAPQAPDDRPHPNPEPPAVAMEKSRYNPLYTLRPQTYFLSVAPGNYSPLAITFTTSGADLVGWHSFDAAIRFDPGAPEPRIDLDYAYGGLPVNLAIGFTRTPVPRTRGFSVGGDTVSYDEMQTAFSTGVSAPLRNPFVSQSVALSYSLLYYSPQLEFPKSSAFDPFGTVPSLPSDGLLSQFRLSYALSTAEGGVDYVGGSSRGFSLRLNATFADPNTGSDSALYTFEGSAAGYIPMPWPGDHTLALRFAGGVSTGNYSRRGTYYVGGYDLASTTPIDTLITGIYDGSFVLRGYEPDSFVGSKYLLATAEYRAPLFRPNWGPSTMPIFFQRLDGSFFLDWGGAFDDFQADRVRVAYNGRPLFVPDLHASIGTELWLSMTLAHRVGASFRLGYAYGFDRNAVENGQVYFIANSGF